MIITIDGPAGTGKSSVARELASRLGFNFLDTGAMYRAVAWQSLNEKIDLTNQEKIGRLAENLQLIFKGQQIFIQQLEITREIRTPEVTAAASIVASNQRVRSALVLKQQEFGRNVDLVTEGRDQGTVVFPNADFKFFLTASPEVRAQRRYEELIQQGISADFGEILKSQIERDFRDQNRSDSPLKPATNSITVDTSDLTKNEVLDYLFKLITNS